MHTTGRPAAETAGFSLLEVLVALTVLSLSLGLLMQIFSAGLSNLSTADHRVRALAVAESVIAAQSPDHLLRDGFTDRGSDGLYGWQIAVRPYAIDLPAGADTPFILYEIAAMVIWDEPAGERSLSLRTLRVGAAGGR